MHNLVHKLQQHYNQQPQKTVLVIQHAGQPDQPVSYINLLNGAMVFADSYKKAGLKPGEVVVLILQHGHDLIFAFWGAILCGAIPSIMPFLTEKLQPERYRKDITTLIEITRPAMLVTYGAFKTEIEYVVSTNSSVRAILTCEEVKQQEEVHLAVDFHELPGYNRHSGEITLLQHSSGTTGLQKGVALSHQAVLNQVESYSQVLNFTHQDIVVSWLPLYHDMGLIAGFVMPILTGAQLILMSPFDWVRAPYRLLQAISHYRGTFCWLPNFALNFCATKIRDRDLTEVDLSCLRGIINCSEPVIWESSQCFSERFTPYGLNPKAMVTCYAMAENVFAVTQSILGQIPNLDVIDKNVFQVERIALQAIEGQPTMQMLSNGPPIPNVAVRVLDERGRDLPDRYVGEIAIRSNCMLNGYYNRPDATAKAFLDGWYLTGDYGYRLDKELYISGRKKDLIIVGGKNIYPQDLESLAMELPGIHPGRVVAFGILNEKTGTEDVILVAEVDTEKMDEQDDLAVAIRNLVTRGSAITLRHVCLVPRGWLIKTSSGKIARSANRDKYLSNISMPTV